jgi:hypothetical protein
MLSVRLLALSLLFHVQQRVIVCTENTYDVQKVLLDKLLQNYSTNVRPVLNHLDTIEVSVNLILKSIIKYDEIAGILTISFGLDVYWNDEILTWDPTDFHGIAYVRLPPSGVWRPRLFSVNAHDTFAIDNHDAQSVLYHFTGEAYYVLGVRSSTICSPNSRYFPFDVHTCYITIIPLNYDDEVCFTAGDVSKVVYEENPLWTLLYLNTTAHTNKQTSICEFRVIITLQRRHSFFMINIFGPIIFLAVINLCDFTLPVQTGERISFAVTVLLSISVFLTLVADNIPKSSITVSLFSVYMLVILTYSLFITFSVIFVSDIHFTEKDKNPKSYVSRFFVWLVHKRGACGCRKETWVQPIHDREVDVDERKEKMHASCTNHKTISALLDKTFSYFYAVVFLSVTLIFMIYVALDSQSRII